MNKLIIIGASGHGKVALDIAEKMDRWDEICFLDDNSNIRVVNNIKIIGNVEDAERYCKEFEFFIAIGNNKIREKIYNFIKNFDCKIVSLIHPFSNIANNVTLEEGVFIAAGVVINTSTIISKGCIINTSSSIDHDCKIGKFVHISPGAHIAGSVNIGDLSWIGLGALINNNLTICPNVIIGSGTLVINHILEYGTYVGIPSKKI